MKRQQDYEHTDSLYTAEQMTGSGQLDMIAQINDTNKTNKMETYTCLALSTGHLTKEDNGLLHSITHRHPHALDHLFYGMVMERDESYFIKLYEERYLNEDIPEFSPALNKIIEHAQSEGHRMIEFDRDAEQYPELFEIFDW